MKNRARFPPIQSHQPPGGDGRRSRVRSRDFPNRQMITLGHNDIHSNTGNRPAHRHRSGAFVFSAGTGDPPNPYGKTPRLKSARRFGVYLGFAASVTGASLVMRISDAIPKLFNAVMCFLHTGRLTLNQSNALQLKFLLLQGIAVVGDGCVFTTFAFGENRVRFIGTEGGLEIDPAAMEEPLTEPCLSGSPPKARTRCCSSRM